MERMARHSEIKQPEATFALRLDLISSEIYKQVSTLVVSQVMGLQWSGLIKDQVKDQVWSQVWSQVYHDHILPPRFDKGIPIPKRKRPVKRGDKIGTSVPTGKGRPLGKGSKYNLHLMEVGDSFFTKDDPLSVRPILGNHKRRNGFIFKCLTVTENGRKGLRVWLVEKR